MKIVGPTVTLCASAALAIASPGSVVAQESIAGIIEEIHGTAFLRKGANAEPVKLDPKVDVARRLYSGEQVRSERGGMLRLRLGDRTKAIQGPSGWFTIRRTASPQSRLIQAALDEYGRLGGRDRGDPVQVFSPSNHSVVMPGQFTVRWNPGPAVRTISLVIQELGGRELWRQNAVDGALGSLAPDSARRRLMRYRVEHGTGPLLLRLVDSDGDAQVTFSLLSVTSEQALKQELALWDRETGVLMPHLGRASVFTRARMFTAAADEYEAALEAAPESRDLLARAILAQSRTGNLARVEELTRRLPAGTTVP